MPRAQDALERPAYGAATFCSGALPAPKNSIDTEFRQ
jgi:hypothetical protein